MGLMAVIDPGVRPTIALASVPTASILSLTRLNATMEGSLSTMPWPRAKTQVLAVPRSIARSFEKIANVPNTKGLQSENSSVARERVGLHSYRGTVLAFLSAGTAQNMRGKERKLMNNRDRTSGDDRMDLDD